MAICQPHNLRRSDPGAPQPFGLRVSLKPGDPFGRLLGTAWSRTHWFETALQRDAALLDMSRKHEYSRSGDRPTMRFDKVEKLGESRGR